MAWLTNYLHTVYVSWHSAQLSFCSNQCWLWLWPTNLIWLQPMRATWHCTNHSISQKTTYMYFLYHSPLPHVQQGAFIWNAYSGFLFHKAIKPFLIVLKKKKSQIYPVTVQWFIGSIWAMFNKRQWSDFISMTIKHIQYLGIFYEHSHTEIRWLE